MLQEEVRESAWFLLIGEKPMLHADSCQSGMIQQPYIYSNGVEAIGSFRVGSASLASRISSCHCPCALPPWAGLRGAGWRIASLARSW